MVGAAGVAALFFRAGLHSPRVLLLLMGIWTLTPFLAMIAALAWSKRWPVAAQSTIDIATLLLTLGTLAAYVYDAFHPRPQAAFWYVVVPPISVTLLAIALLAAWLRTTGGSSRATRT